MRKIQDQEYVFCFILAKHLTRGFENFHLFIREPASFILRIYARNKFMIKSVTRTQKIGPGFKTKCMLISNAFRVFLQGVHFPSSVTVSGFHNPHSKKEYSEQYSPHKNIA